MGKNLPDGGYRPPAKHLCEELKTPFEPVEFDGLPGCSRIHITQLIYGKRTVHYAILQQWREGSGTPWQDVYKIDTSDGSIHSHQHYRNGDQEKRLIRELPKDGRETLEASYEDSYDRVFDAAEDHLRRWMK